MDDAERTAGIVRHDINHAPHTKILTLPANRHHGDSQNGNWKYLYQTWLRIQQRCHNPNDASNANYGERGIRVCAKWRGSYETFAEYVLWNLGERPASCSHFGW
jgi:hypothetical protein